MDGSRGNPGRFEFSGDGGDLRLVIKQAHHVVDGPVAEVIDVDLGSFISLLQVEASPKADAPAASTRMALADSVPVASAAAR